MKNKNKKLGQSALEYLVLTTFILFVFLGFQKYIVRAFSGRWKTSADALGYGRQFDPNKTIECKEFTAGVWYDVAQYKSNNCDCETIQQTPTTCAACVAASANPLCNDY